MVDIMPDEVRLRCSYQRRDRRILRYTVQLEVRLVGGWTPVVRYDNAHGYCHCDTMHPDGTQDKSATFTGDENETFTHAIDELHATWESHRARYLKEMNL